MAGNVKGITVEIGGDTSKLGKALESSEKQSRNLQKELKQVNTALKFNPSNIELLTQKQKLLGDQIKATKEKLDTLKEAEAQVAAQFQSGEIGEEQFRAFQREIIETESKLKTYQSQLEATGKQASALDELTTAISDQEQEVEDLKNEWKNAVLTYGENSDEANRLAGEIDELSSELKENKDKMSALDKAADELDNSLEEVDDSAKRAGEGFTVMKGVLADLASQAIQKVASALVDLGKKTLEVGMNFESSMSNNAALFGATGEELEKLSDTAKHYGETTQFSASEAADALGYMALAGWDVNKATTELGGVLDLAASSGMGLAEASDMVTDYLSAFSNTAMTAGEFADKLAYAQANSNTTARQLGEAYKNSAANLNAAGQDVETVTSLLAAMANQGLKGAESGTALSAMMRDLTAKMEDGEVQIGETLVAVQDANGNYRDLTDILKDVEKATDGMGDAEKAAALSTTFTADSIKGLNLILNDGVDKAAEFENGLRNCDGSAASMAETMNDNVAGSLKLLKSNIESKMITVFERAKGSIQDSIGSMSSALDTIDWNKVGDAVGKFAEKIAELFNYIVNNADTVKAVLTAIGTAIVTVFAVNKVAGFISSIKTLITTFQGLWGVLAANPIGLVAIAVGGLVTAGLALNKVQEKQLENTYGLNTEQKALINKINEETAALDQATEARKKANAAIDAEYGQNQKLWDELQGIVDQNGKIKKGYEDRAAVITGLLAESLGVEIQIVDGQIKKYDELKGSIENVIETKRAEALLDAAKDDYSTAIQNQAESYATYTKAVKEANKTRAELSTAEAKAKDLYDQITNGVGITVEQQTALTNEYLNTQKVVDVLNAKYKDQSDAVSKAEQNYYKYASTIENYEGAMAAMASGDVEALSQAMDKLSNNFMTAETATESMLQKQLSDFKEQYAAMKEAVDAGMPGVTQANVDAMAGMVKAAETELNKLAPTAEKSGKAAGNKHAAGVSSTAGANKTAGAKVASDTNAGMGSKDTKATGKKKGSDYAEGVKSTSGSASTAGKTVSNSANTGLSSADTKSSGKKKGNEYASGVKGAAGSAKKAGKDVADNAKAGTDEVDLTKAGEKTGKQYQKGVNAQAATARIAAKNVANAAKSGISSVSANSAGVAFGQGFASGAGSMGGAINATARRLAASAVASMKAALNSHSPSKVTESIGKDFDQGFLNGIEKGTNPVMKASAKIGKNAAEKVIEGVNKSLKKDKTGKYTKSKLEIYKQYVSKAKSRLSELEKANQINLVGEAKYWRQIIKHVKKGSSAYDSAVSQLKKTKKTFNKEANALLKSFNDDVASAQETMNKAISDARTTYTTEIANLKDAIYGTYKLFDAVNFGDTLLTKDDLTKNLTDQVEAIKEYDHVLEDLNKRINKFGGNEKFLLEIEDMGVDQLKNLEALNSMTDEELKQYLNLYAQKDQYASAAVGTTTTKVLERTRDNAIAAAEKTATDTISKLSKTLTDGLKKIGVDTTKLTTDLGGDIVKGMQSGMSDAMNTLIKQFQKQCKSLVKSTKKTFKIKSPSKVFADEIGKFLPPGISEGFTAAMPKAVRSIQTALDGMVESLQTDLAGAMDLGVMDPEVNGLTFNRQIDDTFQSAPLVPEFDAILDRLTAVEEAIRTSQRAIVLDTGVLVGQTLNQIDNGLANTYALKARGV